ncbi:hypothetical protein Q673_18665 [Marinobacter sp. EN3]|jgi:DNA-binding MltR family transcriptional regulator|uniref:hypothetical protein n=1 Tax=Marinobacter sp. EN3 TaxID=1397533 RepID=UPI0003B80D06|nr:hypothetical protein [Marinobacter sp. EN3]ERS01254.1 hypothetical protein Q673_18665 [Marinobacter sp. EN3]
MSEFSGPEAAELLSDYYDLISKESDRGAVIVAASILDESLGEILKAFLLSPSTRKDDLLDGAYAPLGSFSAKIELCFRLGIIRQPIRQQLMLFKSIRNDVAHRLSVASLQDEKCRSRLAEILKTIPDMTNQIIQTLTQAGIDMSREGYGESLLDTYGCRRTFDLRKV